MARFRDRRDAGELLANHIAGKGDEFDLIVALPRGGVEIALPIAVRLKIPLDVLIVKKLGAPNQPELALGAIASGGYVYVNHELCRQIGLSQRELAQIRINASRELLAREEKLLSGGIPIPWTNRRILIVDDGIATGATMEVAIRAIQARKPASISIAVPVASLSTIERMHRRIDHIFALQNPSILGSVGEFYESFPQLDDNEVRKMLNQVKRMQRREHEFARS